MHPGMSGSGRIGAGLVRRLTPGSKEAHAFIAAGGRWDNPRFADVAAD